jgi:hypothetical protein
MFFNNIISHTKSLEQLMQLSLIESYCLPLLTYATGASSFTQCQLHDLNVCWNTAYRVTFRFNRWESVKCSRHGLDTLNLVYIIKRYRINFFFSFVTVKPGFTVYSSLYTYMTTIMWTTVYHVCFILRRKQCEPFTNSLQLLWISSLTV